MSKPTLSLAVSLPFTGFCTPTRASAMGWPNKSVKTGFFMALVLWQTPAYVKADEDALFDAIVQVETGGNDRAIGAYGEAGPAQITPQLVYDLNRIYGTHYTLADRFSLERSREMFFLYTDHYARKWGHTDRARALVWHRGPRGPRSTASEDYWRRVRALMQSRNGR